MIPIKFTLVLLAALGITVHSQLETGPLSKDSYELYLTKLYIKSACTKEGHSNINHCLKCIMKAFSGSKELQKEIGLCLSGKLNPIQVCFKGKSQSSEIDRCLIDKHQRINCYRIATRKIPESSSFDEVKMKTVINKCQEDPSFLDCMAANVAAPKSFSEMYHRCRVGKLTRICLHKEYPGIDIDNFLYAMKVCPGVGNLTMCLQDTLKDFPKCFLKI